LKQYGDMNSETNYYTSDICVNCLMLL